MNETFTSNGNTTVWLIPATGIVNYKSPTPVEINAGLDITPAIAWEGTTFPTASDSEDVDDRSLRDKGNATSRGVASYEAVLNLFYPKDLKDTVTDYGKVYQMLRVPRVPVYVVTRVGQTTEGRHKDAAAGEWISVYRFVSDGWTDDFEGDDSNKYAIGMLTQGEVAIYTQVKNASPVAVTPTTGSIAVGAYLALRATLGGKRATQVVEWVSSNPSVAEVSSNGIVKGIKAGSATITASHPAASAASTAVTITVT